jgi:cellulose synthase/poly-beta-1,6-N-acetylglucosamine synthase-like glycosyltransferase
MERRETTPGGPSNDAPAAAGDSGHPVGDEDHRAFPRIVAVIPALDEAPSIGRVVETLREGRSAALHRIVVVDNGSTDGTGEIALRAGASVVREERRGYGYACLTGVLAAEEADVIVLGTPLTTPTTSPPSWSRSSRARPTWSSVRARSARASRAP